MTKKHPATLISCSNYGCEAVGLVIKKALSKWNLRRVYTCASVPRTRTYTDMLVAACKSC